MGLTPSAGGPPRVARRELWIGGVAVAGVAAAGGAWWLTRPKAPRLDPLVAVLPFDNLSPDAQLGYFADGLSEDILNALIRGGGVRVTSRSSSFTFRGPAKAKAGETLKANYLLDGSVLREGARLRVNAHLSDVATQQTLWSESYDRDVGEGLKIEDEVAGQVATALKVRLTPGASGSRLVDPTAYDLYLRGREATRDHTPDGMERGRALLHQAIDRAPDFSAAWFELAKNYLRAGFLTPVPEQPRHYELGREAARRAIALDPRNGAAYGLLAELTPYAGHWSEVETAQQRSLALTPNDGDLQQWRGRFLFQTGRFKAALGPLRRAFELDPLDLFVNHILCVTLTFARRFDEAETISNRIAAIWPDQIAAYWDRLWLLFDSNRLAEVLTMLDHRGAHPDVQEEYAVLGQSIRAILSNSAEQRHAAAQACLKVSGLGMGYASNFLSVLGRMGEFDAAVELARGLYLQKGPVAIDRNIQFVGNHRYPPHGQADAACLLHPFLAPLRKSGRLNEIFDALGLTEYWRTNGPPDD